MIRVSFLMLLGRIAAALDPERDGARFGAFQNESSATSSGFVIASCVLSARNVAAPDKSPRLAENRGSPTFLLGEWL